MSKYSIITIPNKILRQKAEKIPADEIKNGDFLNLMQEMTKLMLTHDGIGLAAPQVGQSIRLIVINTAGGALPLFNPRIIKKSWRKEIEEEGCLSVPKTWGDVKRHYKITVTALDTKGEKITFEAKGLFARVLQHEIDHLDGILFIDKAIKIRKID